MGVNITNINELLIPSSGAPSTWSNMGSIVQSDCHMFKLSGTSTCGVLTDAELFLEIEAFDPVGYNKTVKSFEIAPGKDLETYKSKDPRISFTLYGDETLHNLLQIIESHQTVMFTNLIGAQDEEVHQMTIEVQPDDSLLQIKITLSFKDAETASKICCGSYYEGAPFNECDGEGETGDPNNDPECAEYAVTITLTPTPDTLTASTVGGPLSGVETFKWYKDGVFFGEGTSINPVASGVYRVDAKKGNCSDSDSFTYSIGCEGYEVTIQTVILSDGTTIYLAQATIVSTFQWQELIAAVWTDIVGETGVSFEPVTTGSYRVVGTAGTCTDESLQEDFTAAVSCDGLYTITLENVDGTLTTEIVDYAGEGTPSYAWYLDTGTGLTLLGSETGATIANAAPGFYQVIVTLDECIQTAGLLVQCDYAADDNDCVDDSEWYQEFNGDDVSVSFAVTNFLLPDPAFVNATEINATLLVQVNGVTREFLLVPVDGTKYGIDYPNQEIELAAGFPLMVGEILTVRKLRWVKI